MNTPIKRHTSLKPLSHDHHHSLLLCWKIRTGFRKKIEIGRMKSYADWFYKNYLLPHFEVEEKYVFPFLGNTHELVKRAWSEHQKLRRLFEGENDAVKSLGLIEEKLEQHIRFEERVLFNEIQGIAPAKELEDMVTIHSTHASSQPVEEWKDEFWK